MSCYQCIHNGQLDEFMEYCHECKNDSNKEIAFAFNFKIEGLQKTFVIEAKTLEEATILAKESCKRKGLAFVGFSHIEIYKIRMEDVF